MSETVTIPKAEYDRLRALEKTFRTLVVTVDDLISSVDQDHE